MWLGDAHNLCSVPTVVFTETSTAVTTNFWITKLALMNWVIIILPVGSDDHEIWKTSTYTHCMYNMNLLCSTPYCTYVLVGLCFHTICKSVKLFHQNIETLPTQKTTMWVFWSHASRCWAIQGCSKIFLDVDRNSELPDSQGAFSKEVFLQ